MAEPALDEQRLRRLIDAGRGLLIAPLDVEPVLRQLLDVAREVTGARYAAVGVLDEPRAVGTVFEIGGPEVLEYVTMLRRVARIKNSRLAIVPVPLLTPGLSSLWLALVTDVDTQTGRSLIDSMSNEVVVRDDSITRVVPFEPMGYDEAVRVALAEHAARRDCR